MVVAVATGAAAATLPGAAAPAEREGEPKSCPSEGRFGGDVVPAVAAVAAFAAPGEPEIFSSCEAKHTEREAGFGEDVADDGSDGGSLRDAEEDEEEKEAGKASTGLTFAETTTITGSLVLIFLTLKGAEMSDFFLPNHDERMLRPLARFSFWPAPGPAPGSPGATGRAGRTMDARVRVKCWSGGVGAGRLRPDPCQLDRTGPPRVDEEADGRG